MKNIIYCRRSSEDSYHQVLSIESQQKELLDLAERHNIKIDKVFTESMSARKPGRPEFSRLVKFIEHNPKSIVLVWKLDRLARNPKDEGDIKWLLQTGIIAKIITPERTYCPEDNVLVSGVEFSMAAQYSIDLSKNVKRGNKTKLEKGEWPNRSPLGYIDNKITKQKELDPIRGPLVKQAFELYATGGYSLKQVNQILENKGLRTRAGCKLSKALLHKILMQPFYYGTMKSNGQTYSGNHQPLINKALFDQVQAVLTGKHHSKKQKHFFPLRGYMNCYSCGCLLTATIKKGHVYFYCTNGKGNCEQHRKYLRDKAADELVANVFNEIKFDPEDVEIAYQAAKEKTINQGGFSQDRQTELTKQLKTAQSKLANLIEMISSDPGLKEAVRPKILSLEQDVKLITKQISDLGNITPQQQLITLEQTKKAFLQACSASFDYLSGGDCKKFELLKILLWNLKIENQKVQQYQFKPAFQLMAESPKKMEIFQWWAEQDSNLRSRKGA